MVTSSATAPANCDIPAVGESEHTWQPRSWWMARLVELFSCDLRSLALFRVCLALILLSDMAVRFSDLQAHYTDFGVLPRFALLASFLHPWAWSIHLLGGTWWFEALLLAIQAVFALMLLIGYRTRLATIASWLLVVSLQNRNPLVLQGGDILYRMELFWGMFVPLGTRYSVDSALNSSPTPPPKRIISFGTIGLLIQMALIYVFAVIHKSEKEWIVDGTALYYALSIDQFSVRLAFLMLKFPTLMKLFSRAVYTLQALGPWALFFPFWNAPIRTVTAFLFIGWHLSMTQFLAIGLFPFMSSAAMVPFLPSWFWNKITARLLKKNRLGKGFHIYYDIDCGFCRKTVLLLQTFLILPEAKITPAQDIPLIAKDMMTYNSWIVVDPISQRHIRFDAFLTLLQASLLFWWLAPFLNWKPLKKIGTTVYSRVANNRPFWSRETRFFDYRPLPVRLPLFANVLAGVAIVVVLWWNVATVYPGRVIVPEPFRGLALTLGWDQMWNMFSIPLRDDGWYVIPGKLKNGQVVDVYTEKPYVTYAKPRLVSYTYKNQRWQKYMMNLLSPNSGEQRLRYGQYLCRNWNAHHQGDEQLQEFQLVFVREYTLPNYTTAPPLPLTLSQHSCFKSF
jgi:hypothetical protein